MTEPIKRRSRFTWLACVLALTVVVALTGCGSSKSSSSSAPSSASSDTAAASSSSATTSSTHFAKTKFVLHAGLAFGAFHRYIYKPLRAGDFKHPTLHKLEVVKAVAAAAFTLHEVKLAVSAAEGDPALSKLTAPLADLGAKLRALPGDIRGNNASGIESANGLISSIKGKAASAGQPIQEQ